MSAVAVVVAVAASCLAVVAAFDIVVDAASSRSRGDDVDGYRADRRRCLSKTDTR